MDMEKYQIQEMPGQWFEVGRPPWSEERQRWEEVLGEPRIFADLMKTTYEGHLALLCLGTRVDLRHYGWVLREGMRVPFWEDDGDAEGNHDPLVFDGTVNFDAERGYWTADVDENQIRNLSETRRRSSDPS